MSKPKGSSDQEFTDQRVLRYESRLGRYCLLVRKTRRTDGGDSLIYTKTIVNIKSNTKIPVLMRAMAFDPGNGRSTVQQHQKVHDGGLWARPPSICRLDITIDH